MHMLYAAFLLASVVCIGCVISPTLGRDLGVTCGILNLIALGMIQVGEKILAQLDRIEERL